MQVKQCIAKYIRLSSEDADVDGKAKGESNSVTAQRKLITGFLLSQKEFAGIPAAEYVDDGYSGTNFQRPGFQRMMEDAKAGRVSVIVVKDFSRFGRDHLEVGNYLEKILPLLGVRLISVNDGFDSANCAGVTGGMSVALKNMLNAMYSRDLSKKVRSAMTTHAVNGEYMPAHPKYGYRKDPADRHHLVIDPEAAEVVRLVFTMAAEGKNKNQIAKYLNENHVPTCQEHMHKEGIKVHVSIQKEKKLWSVTTIGDMLQNEVYLGKTIWNIRRVLHDGDRTKLVKNAREDWVVVDGTHEPIVSEKLFAEANARAFTHEKRGYKPRKKTTTLLFCPSCGRHMSLTGRGKSYRCARAATTGLPECSNSKIGQEELYQAVLSCAGNMVQFISENLEKKKKEWMETAMQEEKINTLQNERKRLSSRKMKLYSDYRSGNLSKEQYMAEIESAAVRIAEIDQRIPEIENEILEAQTAMAQAASKQTELNDVAALKKYDAEVLSKIIDKVFIYGGGRIEIVWKMDDIFYDGAKREVIEVESSRKEE